MWNHSLFRIGAPAALHRIVAMLFEPFVHIEEEVLLGPKHSGQRLAHDKGFISADTGRSDGLVELVRLALASLHDRVETP